MRLINEKTHSTTAPLAGQADIKILYKYWRKPPQYSTLHHLRKQDFLIGLEVTLSVPLSFL